MVRGRHVPVRDKVAEVHGNRTHHGHLCPSLDLKSRRPTRTCPLPKYKLMDFLFKVKGFEFVDKYHHFLMKIHALSYYLLKVFEIF